MIAALLLSAWVAVQQPAPAAAPAGDASTPATTGSAAAGATSIEDEVLANVRAQEIGAGATVADLAYSEAYLRRVGDRIVRATFEARYRRVLPDEVLAVAAQAHSAQAAPAPAPEKPDSPATRRWLAAGGVALVLIVMYLLSRRGSAAPAPAPARERKDGKR